MKKALVLSGGGAKGCFQVGVIERLFEKGYKPDVIYGTSVGALNAVGLAYSGLTGLLEQWLSIESRSDILRINWMNLIFSSGLYSMSPLRERIRKNLANTPTMTVKVCVCDLLAGKSEYYSNESTPNEVFAKMVEASAAIPVAMEIPDDRYADGGVREQFPLSKAIEDGCTEIVAIGCNPLTNDPTAKWGASFPKAASIAIRALDVMEHEVLVNDIRQCRFLNEFEGFNEIDVKFYTPPRLWMDTLDFDPKKIREGISMGRMAL